MAVSCSTHKALFDKIGDVLEKYGCQPFSLVHKLADEIIRIMPGMDFQPANDSAVSTASGLPSYSVQGCVVEKDHQHFQNEKKEKVAYESAVENDQGLPSYSVQESEEEVDEQHFINEKKEKIATSTKFQCTTCFKQFGRRHHLNRHVVNVHKKQGNFFCPHCKEAFYDYHSMKRHVSKHPQNFVMVSQKKITEFFEQEVPPHPQEQLRKRKQSVNTIRRYKREKNF